MTINFKTFHKTHWPRIYSLALDKIKSENINEIAIPMIKYQMESGGKRLRPAIVAAVCEAFGAHTSESDHLAAAIEFIHNASLVHDDVEDKDETRRGKPCIWKKFSEEQAINIGDLMFSIAISVFLDSDLDDSRKLAIITEINRGVTGISDGQILDVNQKIKSIHDKKQYFRMIDGKTGALFALAFAGGALTASSLSLKEYKQLSNTGITFGRLFQIRDDFIDALGLKEGRKAGRDIIEGKMSFPAILAFEKLNETDKNRLLEIHRMPLHEKNEAVITEALGLYEKVDVFSDIQTVYAEYEETLINLSEFNNNVKNIIISLLELLKPALISRT